TTIEQQVALDEALVPSTKRLPSDIQSKESTLQVVYDVLRISPFFKAFLVTADVPEIYMQEFWAISYVHQHSIRFKMDTRKNIVDLEAFREMLHISPRVPGQSFAELPFKEEILAIINKCLTRKSSGFDSLRLSQAQILWGLYHRRNIDYAFLIWKDFMYQVEHKNQKKSNEMYYPRFTKVIIHHFMTKKPSIPRRNKVNWHYVRDDILFSTIKVVSRHQNTQQYGAILPIELTTEDIRNTKAYKEYYACATGEAAPKPKASARRKRGGFDSSTTPPTAVASSRPITYVAAALRLTTAAKGKQPARATSPNEPLEVERTEAEQLKIILKRSRQETHISQHGGFSTDEGTGSKLGVPDVPSDNSDEEISWNSSDEEDVDDQTKGRDNNEGEKTDASDADNDDQDKTEKDDDDDQDETEKDDDDDNDDDNEEEITKLDEQEDTESGEGNAEDTKSDGESVEEETREEEEESFDPIPRTMEDDEDDGNGKEDQGLRISEEERIQEEEEADELYRDVDINQGRGLQVSQDIEDSHVTLTPVQPDGQQESSLVSSFVTSMLNPTSDAGVESIFMTASSPIAPLPTHTPIMTPSTIATITTSSEAPIPPTTIPRAVLENLPTFDSVFCFEERVKSLEVNFSEFLQTNQFAEAVSKILGIVHQYMTQKMTEAVREAVQIQTNRLQDSFQRENDEFLRTIDENMKKIIKGQVKSQVKEQVSRILPRIEESVNAQLEAEMEGNKSIQRSDKQQNLYKALVDAYEADKTILESYGATAVLKRRRGDDDDDQEGPFAGSDRGSKRRRQGGEPESASITSEPTTRSAGRSTTGTQSRQMSASESAFAEEPTQTTCQMDEPPHPVFETAIQGSAQTWISELVKQDDSRSSFNELLDTPIDFSNFIMNRLGVDTLTPELLAGPTYELMRGSCNSLTELEYHLEEVYKATTDQLDWINPEGQQYPHNLLQPLPLIPDNRGRRVIPFAHFINNDLDYLRGGASSRKYTTSVTKTKASDYEHIQWIEDLFYGFAVNRESALDVYSKRRIIAVTDLKIVEWHNYKHLDWIFVRRDDDKIYKFKEGDFKRLRVQDIEDMLLLLVQGKLSNLTVEERFAFKVSLRMFTRSIVIQ
nr:hypothetical protein [Tanacetum cinerariifolium]